MVTQKSWAEISSKEKISECRASDYSHFLKQVFGLYSLGFLKITLIILQEPRDYSLEIQGPI